MCLLGTGEEFLWKILYYIAFIFPPGMLLLWEFLLILRLSLISQNALVFCSSDHFWSPHVQPIFCHPTNQLDDKQHPYFKIAFLNVQLHQVIEHDCQ